MSFDGLFGTDRPSDLHALSRGPGEASSYGAVAGHAERI